MGKHLFCKQATASSSLAYSTNENMRHVLGEILARIWWLGAGGFAIFMFIVSLVNFEVLGGMALMLGLVAVCLGLPMFVLGFLPRRYRPF